MTILNILKRFEYKQFIGLFILSIRYPLFIYPTLKATSESYQVAKAEFPEAHGKNGTANAFRHAYWNALICFECHKWSKSRKRIMTWSKLITDKHEELSPNSPLETAMDIHNNRIGRNNFIASNFMTTEEIMETIKSKLQSAQVVDSKKSISLHPLELVYLKEV